MLSKTIISVTAKCSDCCAVTIKRDGVEIATMDGYVPTSSSGFGGGDYIEFDVDAETGQILSWKNPISETQFQDDMGMNKEENDDD